MNRFLHTPAFPRPRLAVSACLLGEQVRYDGGHKRHAFLTEVLVEHVDYLPLCPETGIGMDIPRAPIQLVGEPGEPRALGVQDPSIDVTARLQQFAAACAGDLHSVSGYLFKKDSPSCGVRRVKLFASPGGQMRRRATGVFAAAVQAANPLLPVEQEDALDNRQRRENFLSRLYVYRRWQTVRDNGLSSTTLRDFHTAHTPLIMAHSLAACRRLTQLLASASAHPPGDVADRYIRDLLTTLARPASHQRHCAVHRQLARYLEPHLDDTRRAELQAQLQAYRDGELSLGKAVAALRVPFERCAGSGIPGHTYLYPYPDALRLQEG